MSAETEASAAMSGSVGPQGNGVSGEVFVPIHDTQDQHNSWGDPLPDEQLSTAERARRIHASVYLREGYITIDDIGFDGFIKSEVDPYVDQSEYFYAESPERRVAARQIYPKGKEGILSLPTLKNFSCDPQVITETAGVERLTDLRKSEVVEISAVAAMNGAPSDGRNLGLVVDTYVKMLRTSIEKGHKLWVMGTDRRLTRKLNGLLGNDLFRRMGERRNFMGSPTDPMALNPQTVVADFLSDDDPTAPHQAYKGVMVEGLQGIDVTNVSAEMREILENAGVETTDGGRLREFWETHKPEIVAAGGLVGYTALRAAPVAQIEEFHGNPWVFFGIDAGTALPYTAGMSWMLRSENAVAKKAAGAVVASSSFAAPYVYLWANGENYPGYVNGAIGGFIALGIVKEGVSHVLVNRREKLLTEGLVADRLEP